MPRARACAGGEAAGSAPSRLSEQPVAGDAERRQPRRHLADGIAADRHRSPAVDQSAQAMARPRHVPARERRRRMAGPVRCGAWRNRARHGSRRCSPAKPRSASHGGRTRAALHALLPWALKRRLDAEAPTHFEAPTGSQVPIDYEAEGGPKIAIRVQELFGLNRHPAIAGGKIPLLIELLSPAHRPVQTTRDLPGFLARQLRRRAHRDARTLSETPVARRPERGCGDAARKAAEKLTRGVLPGFGRGPSRRCD